MTKTPKPKQKDHPRRCGENFDVFIITSKQIGSPPQVRGKLFVPADITTKSRITPAGAGKTERYDRPPKHGDGSPPQVRGKPYDLANGRLPNRITPAGAGKTRYPECR